MAQQTATNRGTSVPIAEQPSTWARTKTIIGVVALAALVLFLLQNLQEVEIHFLWFDWNTRMIWALLAAAIAGAVGTVVFSTLRGRAERARVRAQRAAVTVPKQG